MYCHSCQMWHRALPKSGVEVIPVYMCVYVCVYMHVCACVYITPHYTFVNNIKMPKHSGCRIYISYCRRKMQSTSCSNQGCQIPMLEGF